MWSQMSLLVLIAATLKAFTVLPYVQIDFVHYFRLAQCDAKCAEKYGKPIKRRLNDGTFIEYYGNEEEYYKLCTAGCNRHRTVSRRENNGTKNALATGMQFWMDTNAYAGRTENSPIRSVRLGCMDVKQSIDHNDFEDIIEGLVFVDVSELQQQPIRYIVQWKQRTYDGSPMEENGWITASIETEPIIRVEGMVPSMQYRFMVTAIGPGGRMGGPIMSDWAQSLSVNEKLHLPVGPMLITTHYNSDDGLCALINWYHSSHQRHSSPNIPDVPDERPDLFNNCHYSITVSNNTFQQTTLFTMDNGKGILLSNLQFSSEYSVAIRSIVPQNIATNAGNMSYAMGAIEALERKFMTPPCNEIFGPGSLDCAPEPVKDLKAIVEPNGTAVIKWTPSSESNSILIYQLVYQSLTDHLDCGKNPFTTYINAGATVATVQFNNRKHCKYMIKLINYDLIGREASAEISVWYRPNASIISNFNLLLYIFPLFVFCLVVILLKCCKCLHCSRSTNNSKLLLDCNEKDTVTVL